MAKEVRLSDKGRVLIKEQQRLRRWLAATAKESPEAAQRVEAFRGRQVTQMDWAEPRLGVDEVTSRCYRCGGYVPMMRVEKRREGTCPTCGKMFRWKL